MRLTPEAFNSISKFLDMETGISYRLDQEYSYTGFFPTKISFLLVLGPLSFFFFAKH